MCFHMVGQSECGVKVATAGLKPAAYKRRAGSIPATRTSNAPVMELVYMPVLEAVFCEFESRLGHHKFLHGSSIG